MSWLVLFFVVAVLILIGALNVKRVTSDECDCVYRKVVDKWIKVEGGVL